MAYRKTGTRDPSGTLAGSYKNRKTGTLAGPYENRKTGTLQKLEKRDPSEPYINATCGKNVLHKQHGQLGFHFLMFF